MSEPLCLDADFECGSLGPVTVLGPAEYEVQLLSDANGGYVQWPLEEIEISF